MKRFFLISSCLSLTLIGLGYSASPAANAPSPDFTKGDKIPEGFTHDWNLGATGMRGWIYTKNFATTTARQILITQVEKRSPADGVMEVGDVILGVEGKPFSYDPRTEFGKALTQAEAKDGNLKLQRWRAGASEEVFVKLSVFGTYTATAPYNCPKSQRVLEEGCKALAKRMKEDDYPRTQNPMTRSINALALLASGDRSYLPLVRDEAKWASEFHTDSFKTWHYSYVCMLMAEYHLVTGDKSVLPGLKRLAMESATGQSAVGSWGHNFALPDGRLSGYGMMNAPGLPLVMSLIMAQRCGIKEPVIDQAIERSAKLYRFYAGKGSVPYGDHEPWMEGHEDNGKCGMAAAMFNLLGEKEKVDFFARMSVAAHGPERDCGHTGNFTNMLWAMPSVSLLGEHASGAWMKEFGGWYYDFSRTWDGKFVHQGAPEATWDSYGKNWDSTGSYLLAYAMPLKKILLTGKQPSSVPALDAAAAESLIVQGRGWSQGDKFSAYDKLGVDHLLDLLGSWSPIIRERAAMAIQRKPGPKPIAALVKMLDSPQLYQRYGACQAFQKLRGQAVESAPTLIKLLEHEDMWLRVQAAEALAQMGEAGLVALPTMLKRIAAGPSTADPRGMEQRFMSAAVFATMLRGNKSLEGVDQKLLSEAIVAGLKNQDGNARTSVSHVYDRLSLEQLKPLFPAILLAIKEASPSGEMFADGVRINGLKLMAKHHVAEGLTECATYIQTQQKWASEHRIKEQIAILHLYGTHGKTVIPELEKFADLIDREGEKDFPKRLSKQKAADLREAFEKIKASTDTPTLIRAN